MNADFQPGDRVELVASGLNANGKPLPVGSLGTVADPSGNLFKNATGWPTAYAMLQSQAMRNSYDVFVNWDDIEEPDVMGNEFVPMGAHEVRKVS
jgi:hypothetical protein